MNKINENEEIIKKLEEEILEDKKEYEELEEEPNCITKLIQELESFLRQLEKAYEKYPKNKNDDDDYDDRLEAFYTEEITPIENEIESNLREIGVCLNGIALFEDGKDSSFELKGFFGDWLWNKIQQNENRVWRNKLRQLKELDDGILCNELEIERLKDENKKLKENIQK